MVDYFAVLVRAVAQLDPNTSERRRAVYDRVRQALIEKIRAGDPQFSDFGSDSGKSGIRSCRQSLRSGSDPTRGARASRIISG